MTGADIQFYLAIFFRRTPYIAVIFFTAVALSIVAALLMPRVYRSTAKILVEAPVIPADMVKPTVPTSSLDQLLIVQQQITTRANLVELAKQLELYREKALPPTDDIVKDMRSRLVFDQQLLGLGAAAVFSVAFEADTPTLAAKGANQLASLILLTNQRQRTGRAGDTLEFFDAEVTRLGNELNSAESELLKFKTEKRSSLPESLGFRRQQQENQQLRLTSLEREAADLRTRRSVLVDTFAATGQTTTGVVAPKQQVLADLNKALADQLAIFSETSPNIIRLRARIASLQAEAAPLGGPNVDRVTGIGPRSGIELQLADIDKRLRGIEAERSKISDEITLITQSIDATPATETALNSLERERAHIQTQYDAAIARRADASLGEQVETRSNGGRLTLLEEATPPETPLKPKRRLIVAFGAAAGIALSVLFVALLEFLNRTIRRPKELATLLQSQPLAVIPYIERSQDAGLLRRGIKSAFSGLKFG
ncbi:GumC family protein [Rhizobium mesoamericanum]|uniref:Lipopolysaccharide biosynthesis protein n=1 Tax=Rhizobium mesoamericanum STM3625 TaxID=1211777 RepID=K0Q3B1_9HYPH|nr:hypothetical protein [Rhizobium mesoamericanum]CCM79320.1 Lipopolysaccharide biosynthesis protein [Rhizobium mesoamericanum STM3625]